MKYRSVTAEWIAKKFKENFDSYDKGLSLGTRRALASAATIRSIVEFQTSIRLDNFLKPQLEDFVKILNYDGPVFQKVGK